MSLQAERGAQRQESQALRPQPGGVLLLDLDDEVAHLKSSEAWERTDRASKSLVKDRSLNLLLLVLKAGAHLHEHHIRGPFTVMLMSGSAVFHGGQQDYSLQPGSVVAVDEGIAHSAEALAESVLLITTSMGRAG